MNDEKHNEREIILGRIFNIWFIGVVLFYALCGILLYFEIAELDFLEGPQGIIAIIYLLSLPVFIAFFGPVYLNEPSPNAWLD